MRALLPSVISATLLLPLLLAPVAGQAEETNAVLFRLTVQNSSSLDLSPGGYVVHDRHWQSIEGDRLHPAVQSVCRTGSTRDFRFHITRSDSPAIRSAFIFSGGISALTSRGIILTASPRYPYLSLVHRVDPLESTCVGVRALKLFDASGTPLYRRAPLETLQLSQGRYTHGRAALSLSRLFERREEQRKLPALVGSVLVEPVMPGPAGAGSQDD